MKKFLSILLVAMLLFSFAGCKQEISEIICDNCGKSVSIGPAYCPECGSLLNYDAAEEDEKIDPNTAVPCYYCGTYIPMDSEYCPWCGATFNHTSADE